MVMGRSKSFDLAEVMARMSEVKLLPLEPYVNATHPWKCKCLICGNETIHTWATIQQRRKGNIGCASCNRKRIGRTQALSIEVAQRIAQDRGGKLLSKEYENIDSPLQFECSKGHQFKMRLNHAKLRGQWCPTCNKSGKSEEIARTTFEQLFNKAFPKTRPVWLRNARGYRMEIDGYCHELKMGFEYQGIQHFSKSIFGTNVPMRIQDDIEKAKLCKEHGIYLFILTHEMKYEDFPNEIVKQAKQFGITLPSDFLSKKVDIEEAYIRLDRIDELKKLLEPKNILVLSKKYLGSKEKINLECKVCGNRWKANGNAFFNSRRVAGCDVCSRKNAGLRNSLSLAELVEFASKFGGILLSSTYEGAKADYLWQCSKGHEFKKRFSNMKHRNQFCPICDGVIVRKSTNAK